MKKNWLRKKEIRNKRKNRKKRVKTKRKDAKTAMEKKKGITTKRKKKKENHGDGEIKEEWRKERKEKGDKRTK